MLQSQVKFAVLKLSRPALNDGEGISLLMLLNPNSDDGLQIWIDPDWQQRINTQDQQYVSELIEDWKGFPLSQLSNLWGELRKQSHGPLRMIDMGEAFLADCSVMTEKLKKF